MTFYDSINEWKKLYDSPQPHKVPLPSVCKSKFNNFHKLLILRTIRPDKITLAILDYIVTEMG